MLRFMIGCACLVVFSACDRTDRWNPGTPDIPRTEVYVTNFSPERILEVYLRPAGAAGWGQNWLTAPIGGGDLYAHVGQVISGTFDVRMVGELQTQETLGIALAGEAIGISFAAPPPGPPHGG